MNRPKLTPEEVRKLLEEGRRLRFEVEQRIREMQVPTFQDLQQRVRGDV